MGKRETSIARKQSESGKHERTDTPEGLRFDLTGYTILEIWGTGYMSKPEEAKVGGEPDTNLHL